MIGFSPVIHPPRFITRWFPEALWKINPEEKNVYLTFDDGPVPRVTPWVLDLLMKEQVKATFFCVGENVFNYPDIYGQIIGHGHSVGNHTYNHLQGMKTNSEVYLRNTEKASEFIHSNLFRPPHGLMSPAQFRKLTAKYQIVMWDILSRDYHKTTTPDQVVDNVLGNVSGGSIITFHDSVKAFPNLKAALPRVIKMLKETGYGLLPIPYTPKEDVFLTSIKKTG